MKSTALIAAALAYAANDADAFFVPAGGLVNGGSSASRVGQSVSSSLGSNSAVAATRSSGCSCASCSLAGRPCSCPCCSPGGAVSARSRSSAGACAVRMQAHPQSCGCGECSPAAAPAAFKGASCNCPDCGGCSKAAGAPCMCSACTGRPGRRGALATVMSMGAGGQVSAAGEGLRQRLAEEPESVMFEDTMTAIADGFDYTPKRFVNGATSSDAGENEGSCKVFAFGKIAVLSKAQTLAAFGEHYRGVVADPSGDSHGNIRAFMESGWDGIDFPDGLSLSPK